MNFLLIGNGGTTNRGCEAILLSTVALLKKQFPGSRYVNASAKDPRVKNVDYLQIQGLKHKVYPESKSYNGLLWQFNKMVLKKKFVFERFIKEADYVFALGGDNYTLDYDTPDIYFKQNELIHQRGKPMVLWGCSIGPFTAKPDFEQYAANVLKKAFRIVVRETISQTYLDSIGVSKNVLLRPDPAFFLDPSPCALPEKVEKFLSEGCVGINLSPLLGRYRNDDWNDVAKEWIKELLRRVELPIILIPHVFMQGANDYLFMKNIAKKINLPERVAVIPDILSSQEYKYVISRVKVFAGARTHATIAALSTGTPTFSIGYSTKSMGINKDLFGHLHWVESHKELTSDCFADRIVELLKNEEVVREQLQYRLIEYKKFDLDFLD